jgi:hypothetical protein
MYSPRTPAAPEPVKNVYMAKREGAYSIQELGELAAGLRRLLDAIERQELTADAGTISRLEGAAAAIQALADGRNPKSEFTFLDD